MSEEQLKSIADNLNPIRDHLKDVSDHLDPGDPPRFMRKNWWGKLFEPQFFVSTICLTVVVGLFGWMLNEWEDARNKSRKEQERDAAQLNQLRGAPETKHRELQDTLDSMATSKTQFVAFEAIGDLVGYQQNLNHAYLIFGNRTISDLKTQRAINLIDQIEVYSDQINEQLGKKKPSPYFSQSEKINNHLVLGLALAKEFNLISAKLHLDECLNEITIGIGEIDKNDKLTEEEKLGRIDLLRQNAVQAQATKAVVLTMMWKSGIDEKGEDVSKRQPAQFADKSSLVSKLEENFGLLEKELEKGKGEIPIILIKGKIPRELLLGIVAAVEAVIADSFVGVPSSYNDKKVLSQDDKKALKNAYRIADEFFENNCKYVEKLPQSEFRNYIDDSRQFVLLAGIRLKLNRAERALASPPTAEIAKTDAKTDVEAAMKWMDLDYFEAPLPLVVRADRLLFKSSPLAVDLKFETKGLSNRALDSEKKYLELRQRILIHIQNSDPLTKEYRMLRNLFIQRTKAELHAITATGDDLDDWQRNRLELLVGELEQVNFQWRLRPDNELKSKVLDLLNRKGS